jgi:hypothetical protein
LPGIRYDVVLNFRRCPAIASSLIQERSLVVVTSETPRTADTTPLRLAGVFPQRGGIEQIDTQRTLELRIAPGGLACTSRPEQEEVASRDGEESGNEKHAHRKMAYLVPLCDA